MEQVQCPQGKLVWFKASDLVLARPRLPIGCQVRLAPDEPGGEQISKDEIATLLKDDFRLGPLRDCLSTTQCNSISCIIPVLSQ